MPGTKAVSAAAYERQSAVGKRPGEGRRRRRSSDKPSKVNASVSAACSYDLPLAHVGTFQHYPEPDPGPPDPPPLSPLPRLDTGIGSSASADGGGKRVKYDGHKEDAEPESSTDSGPDSLLQRLGVSREVIADFLSRLANPPSSRNSPDPGEATQAEAAREDAAEGDEVEEEAEGVDEAGMNEDSVEVEGAETDASDATTLCGEDTDDGGQDSESCDFDCEDVSKNCL